MTRVNARLAASLVTCAALVGSAAGADAPPSPVELNVVTSQVQSGDPAQVDAGVAKIKQWSDQRIAPSSDMIKVWLPALLQAGRNKEVADICLNEILLTPSVGNSRDFFPLRVTALQNLGQLDDALQSAKSLYNSCDMKVIDKAIPVVAHALELARPNDRGIGQRFTLEQALSTSKAAAAGGAEGAGGAGGAAATSPAAILKSVKIDQKPYEKALADWKKKNADSLPDKEKYGNLLLMADQGAEGDKVFHELVLAGPGDAKRYKAGVVRALKTEDGNLTRANAAPEAVGDNALP